MEIYNGKKIKIYCHTVTGKNKSSSRAINATLSADRRTEPSYQLRWRCPWATWSPCCLTLGKRSASRLSAAGLDSRSAAAKGIVFVLSRRRSMRRCWRTCGEDEGPRASRKSLEAKVLLAEVHRPRDMARDAWARSSKFLRLIRSRLASSLIMGKY